jgi:hypothetical protein
MLLTRELSLCPSTYCLADSYHSAQADTACPIYVTLSKQMLLARELSLCPRTYCLADSYHSAQAVTACPISVTLPEQILLARELSVCPSTYCLHETYHCAQAHTSCQLPAILPKQTLLVQDLTFCTRTRGLFKALTLTSQRNYQSIFFSAFHASSSSCSTKLILLFHLVLIYFISELFRNIFSRDYCNSSRM